MKEQELRKLCTYVFGRPISDEEWNKKKSSWQKPFMIRRLQAKSENLYKEQTTRKIN